MNTPRDLASPLERITWRDGQTLASRDLRDDQRFTGRLRHLHIRYLHRTWGIVEGLQVTAQGSTAVVVSPGYAIDSGGHELLEPLATRLLAPAQLPPSTTVYLVLSRDQTRAGCSESVDLSSLCPGTASAIAVERGALAWKTAAEVHVGPDVLLARVLATNGKLAGDLDTSIVRYADTARPHTWADSTAPGSTGWRDSSEGVTSHIEATVDTSDAGFTATPVYFARLSFPAGKSPLFAGYVREVSANSFTFVLRPVSKAIWRADVNAGSVEQAGVTIQWSAFELQPGPPIVTLKGTFS